MGDVEEGCMPELTEGRQKKLLGCCGCLSLLGIIIFSVAMSAYVHLGPDDQILIMTFSGKRVINGPSGGTQLNPFQKWERRKATLLDPLQYAIVQDQLTAIIRAEVGPQMFFLGPNDVVKSIEQKIVLEKDEYIRLVDRLSGGERVEQGPSTIVPTPTEVSAQGVQKAIPINVGTAVEVRNKLTGARALYTPCNYEGGIFVPEALQEIVEVRSLIHVLPHEAMIVRDVEGKMTVYSGREDVVQAGQCITDAGDVSGGVGGTAFFLPPFSKIVRMSWSTYANPVNSAGTTTSTPSTTLNNPEDDGTPTTPIEDGNRRLEEVVESSMYVDQASPPGSSPKRKVTTIDMRTQKSFYTYEVRTSDNVKLEVSGTIFWQIEDVRKMVVITGDPEGDVWARSRSLLISKISETDLATFMSKASDIVDAAFANQTSDPFFEDRGLKLVSMEMTGYTPIDQNTKDTLQGIIRQTVNRINELEKQRSENDVLMEKLTADIDLEKNRTMLIETQAENSRLVAETAGAADGGRVASSVSSFIDGLNSSLSDTASRLELYRNHRNMASAKLDTQQLSTGSAKLYMAPQEMELRLSMPNAPTEL